MAGEHPEVWAPGRVNLIGEHTDYSGGLVLPIAIELGVTLTVLERSAQILLSSTLTGATQPLPADGSGAAPSGWGRYVHAVAAELAALGRPAAGLTGTVDSTLPAGAGLSSSAALEVAVALALCAVADFELEALELALACQRAELRAVGVPCGILDQAACLLGRADAGLLLECGTLDHRFVRVPAGTALLVVDSGVERSLEHTAYASRRRELEEALAQLGADTSIDLELDDLDALDGVSKRRLRHVVSENDRVRRFAAALEADAIDAAGALLLESHASLRDDYEVSIAELDLLVELAVASGAHGARLLGAGFGGSVLALVAAETAAAAGEGIASRYRARTGKETRVLEVHASTGARFH
jgi:galactokinase